MSAVILSTNREILPWNDNNILIFIHKVFEIPEIFDFIISISHIFKLRFIERRPLCLFNDTRSLFGIEKHSSLNVSLNSCLLGFFKHPGFLESSLIHVKFLVHFFHI